MRNDVTFVPPATLNRDYELVSYFRYQNLRLATADGRRETLKNRCIACREKRWKFERKLREKAFQNTHLTHLTN